MPTATLARATSADAELLDRLPGRLGHARVHSVFRRVVNVRSAHPTLISFAARGVPDAPGTIVTDLEVWDEIELSQGDPVVADSGRILLGGAAVVALAGVARWDSTLPTLPMTDEAVAWLRSFLAREGTPGGMRRTTAVAAGRATWAAALEHELERRSGALLTALRGRDPRAVVRAATALHGLGPGLTPAGDDALLGLALVCQMPGSRLGWALPALRQAVAGGSGTTAVAAAALAHGLDGRAAAPVMDLLGALSSGFPTDQLTLHGRRVLAIGHTSGTDLLCGLSAGLDLDQEMRGDR